MIKRSIFIISVLFGFSQATVCGNPNESLLVEFRDSAVKKFVCPAASEEDEIKLKRMSSKVHAELKYCLFDEKFSPGKEEICQYEVKPGFFTLNDDQNQSIPCGSKKNQFLYYFGYYYCGGKSALNEILKMDSPEDLKTYLEASTTTKSVPMYIVCFDISKNKAVWTQHSVQTPALFQDPTNIENYCDTEISKKSFSSESSFFKKLEKRYKSAEKKTFFNSIPTISQPIVPPEHFALRAGKKTTYHYINRGPLWKDLVPLMAAIDHGIRTASVKLIDKEFSITEPLFIYTKVTTVHSITSRIKRWFNIEPFEPNIWSKFIYLAANKQAAMIYIHNTPGQKVKKKCEKEMYCDFKAWASDGNIQEKITEKNLEYAYCCQISEEEAAKEFLVDDFNIRGYFDINFLASRRKKVY